MIRAVEWAVGLATVVLVAVGGWAMWAARRKAVSRSTKAITQGQFLYEAVAEQEAREVDGVVARSEERRTEVHAAAELEGDAGTDAVTDLLTRRRTR